MKKFLPALALLPLLPVAMPVLAQDDAMTEAEASPTVVDGKVFPRYASLKKSEVNVRSGPGNKYPILWVYQRTGYPVQLLTKYDNYYKLRDVEGEEGWVYVGMVSPKLTALVGGKDPIRLLKYDSADSLAVARLAPGVVVDIRECTDVGYCKVDAGGYRGWVTKAQLEMVE